ncbi:hypothetical protein J2S22_002361 [Rhodoplanes tepidamans]|nr:hypothetical protein [Rhodoplanes tepidamans]
MTEISRTPFFASRRTWNSSWNWSRKDRLTQDPFSGHLFAFRDETALVRTIPFWDGNVLCLITKRIDQGGFVRPEMAGIDGPTRSHRRTSRW